MRRLRNWWLRTFCGYVRVSDYVKIEVNLTAPTVQAKFNPTLIVGKHVR